MGSAVNAGASFVLMTLMDSVASVVPPLVSLARTVKLLAPTSLLAGVPEIVPLEATASHAGPETLL